MRSAFRQAKINSTKGSGERLRYVALFFLFLALWIIARLFILQIWQHDYYALFALNSREIYQKLHPTRGAIYFQDTRSKELFPAAINRDYYLVYAVPKDVPAGEIVSTTRKIIEILDITTDEAKTDLLGKLSKRDDPYELVAKKVSDELVDKLKMADLPGIHFTPQEHRYYPEDFLAATVIGFTGLNRDGNPVGRYGLEGYWENKLAGKGGFLAEERGAQGSWIALSERTTVEPENGASLVLTIDRTLQYQACERLRAGMVEYKAKSAALVILDPTTGAILAMCSLPDFDPNNYSKVEDIAAFNNTTIYTPYEPGSVFKPITMAVGLDLELVSPATKFTDPCEYVINGYKVRNAERKCWGEQTMTNVLEHSVNTGVVWLQKQIDREVFASYVKKFGFGIKSGIELDTESAGDISSFDKKGEIFAANASFGQGITVTPLQLAASYAAIAHEGKLPQPYIVEEVRFADGRVEKTTPKFVDQPMSPRAAKLLSGMLTSVIENTYKKARVERYFVAGKTGTAQIADQGGYSADRTNHTFAGFAPVDNPRFVIVVKFEEPDRPWAEQTTIPVFKDVLEFALNYYAVPGTR